MVRVELYYSFAGKPADRIAVMVWGEAAMPGPAGDLDEAAVHKLLTA
jgi:ABC-type branched-subunit amino acid transport system ATPase component